MTHEALATTLRSYYTNLERFPVYHHFLPRCGFDPDGIIVVIPAAQPSSTLSQAPKVKSRDPPASSTEDAPPRPIISAEAARSIVFFPVQCTADILNGHGTMHGGVAAFIIDSYTSMHLTSSGLVGQQPHVTVNLNTEYLKPVALGTPSLYVMTRIVKAGRTLAFLEAAVVQATFPSGPTADRCGEAEKGRSDADGLPKSRRRRKPLTPALSTYMLTDIFVKATHVKAVLAVKGRYGPSSPPLLPTAAAAASSPESSVPSFVVSRSNL